MVEAGKAMEWTGLRVGRLVGALLVGIVAAGCVDQSSATEDDSADRAPVTSSATPEVLATIGDEEVTVEDIRRHVGGQLDQLEMSYQRARSRLLNQGLEQTLDERVLGAEVEAQGKTFDQLVAEELGGELEPSDVEIAAWYEDNQDRLGGRSLDQVRTQIRDHLRGQRREEGEARLRERVYAERQVEVHLEPFRVRLDNADAPARGPEDAPVVLTEFSDFECPYCRSMVPTLQRLAAEFGDDLRIVYRQFPLTSIHQNAFKAAEASLCAHEQGEFWAMHDLMFEEQDNLLISDLKEKAGRAGLEWDDFVQCLDSGRYVEQIQNDLQAGQRLGVTGTPAFFVNGRPIDGGAVEYDVVADMIREELDHVRQ